MGLALSFIFAGYKNMYNVRVKQVVFAVEGKSRGVIWPPSNAVVPIMFFS